MTMPPGTENECQNSPDAGIAVDDTCVVRRKCVHVTRRGGDATKPRTLSGICSFGGSSAGTSFCVVPDHHRVNTRTHAHT